MSEKNNDNNNQQQPVIKDNERDKEELMDNLDCRIYHSLALQICIHGMFHKLLLMAIYRRSC
jgi:hypothetical protein